LVLNPKQQHQVQFPTLARIAQDYLAIPGSSVASERAFSSMRHIGTDHRNKLSTEMFQAIQILKGGYKAGLIGAAAEVIGTSMTVLK
jgi:hAT family C-terminal dimerisation region